MIWILLILAIAAFAIALKTSSVVVAVVCLLAALALVVGFVMGLLARRIGTQSRDDSMILDPQELRRMREQADARRAAGNPDGTPSA